MKLYKCLALILISFNSINILAQDLPKYIDIESVKPLVLEPFIKDVAFPTKVSGNGKKKVSLPSTKLSVNDIKFKKGFLTSDGYLILQSKLSNFHHLDIISIAFVDISNEKEMYKPENASFYSFYNPKWNELKKARIYKNHDFTIDNIFNLKKGFSYKINNRNQKISEGNCIPQLYMPIYPKRIIRNSSIIISSASFIASGLYLYESNKKYDLYKNQTHFDIDRIKSENYRKFYYSFLGIGLIFIIPIVITI